MLYLLYIYIGYTSNCHRLFANTMLKLNTNNTIETIKSKHVIVYILIFLKYIAYR